MLYVTTVWGTLLNVKPTVIDGGKAVVVSVGMLSCTTGLTVTSSELYCKPGDPGPLGQPQPKPIGPPVSRFNG
jgi:hypothetical protein